MFDFIKRDNVPAETPEDRVAVATQWQLIWWRFRRHRLALFSAFVVLAFYVVVIFADFFAVMNPHSTDSQRSFIPPQKVHFFDQGAFRPHVFALTQERDPRTFRLRYVESDRKLFLRLFAEGYSYPLFGLFETNRHLVGVANPQRGDGVHFLGTDLLGRDLLSRIVVATQISLSIGLAAVFVSLLLGVLLGGLSAVYGGLVDVGIQRLIEILRSIPTIPLWMALAASLPRDWSVLQVYFAITIIISLLGWTELARVVRGRFLALKQEDFITAAEISGASYMRIIFSHMLPSFLSHIIAVTTLALPAMIISETSLSFLGLGLRPPAISWGILLHDAQNIESLALAPWLLLSALPVIVVILAFNFLGDGLRDAADPYG